MKKLGLLEKIGQRVLLPLTLVAGISGLAYGQSNSDSVTWDYGDKPIDLGNGYSANDALALSDLQTATAVKLNEIPVVKTSTGYKPKWTPQGLDMKNPEFRSALASICGMADLDGKHDITDQESNYILKSVLKSSYEDKMQGQVIWAQ